MIKILKYILPIALGGLLLYLAFRNVEFGDFWEKAKTVDYTWVIVSIVLSLLAYYARAYRWNILLRPLGYPALNTHRTNLAIMIGYLANLALPRLGEVTRCGMLRRSDGVKVPEALGTVVAERLIDLFSLIALIVVALIMEYDRLMAFLQKVVFGGRQVEGVGLKMLLIVIGAGVLMLAVGYALYKKVPKVREFLQELGRGAVSLKDIENVPGFIISTVVLWVTYYFMSYLIVFSMPETEHLSWSVGIMLLVTGGLALVVPVQGGIGTYHAFIAAMLSLYAIDHTTGVFLATLLHTSQVVAIAIFGGIALIISLFINKKKDARPA